MATRKSAGIFIFENILWPSESSQIFIMSRNIFDLLLILMVGSRIILPDFAFFFVLPVQQTTSGIGHRLN